MRIFVGVLEIAGQIPVYADGFKQLGHEVITAVRHKIPWYEADYNFELNSRELTLDDAIIIGYILGSCDVFVYEWAREGLLPFLKDLEFIKDLGKKSVSIFQGSDVRYYPAYPDWYAKEKKHLLKIPFPYESISDSLRSLRKAELLSHLILSLQNQSILGVRPYMHSFLPIKISDYPFNVPAREVPVVVHAPSRKWLKGSELIEQALRELKSEGVPFEAFLLHNVPNKDVINALINADVAIDQLLLPLSGKLTLEAMACGCAVASGDREEYEPFPPNRPIWHIDYDGVKDQLRELLTNKELRLDLAYKGRKYVERYHDHVGVANRILHLLFSEDDLMYDYYPDYYFNHFSLKEKEYIAEDVLNTTAEIILKWGVPANVSIADLVKKGLLPQKVIEFEERIPRWEIEGPIHHLTVTDYMDKLFTADWMEERRKSKEAVKVKDELAQRFAEIIAYYNERKNEKAHQLIKNVVERFPTRVEAWVAYSGLIKH